MFACAATFISRVYGVHEGREKDNCFGAFRTGEEAQAQIRQLGLRVMNGENWAERYHNKGFVIREKFVTTDLRFPLAQSLGTNLPSSCRRNLIDRERGTRRASRFSVGVSLRTTSNGSASMSATTQCSGRSSRSDRGTEDSR